LQQGKTTKKRSKVAGPFAEQAKKRTVLVSSSRTAALKREERVIGSAPMAAARAKRADEAIAFVPASAPDVEMQREEEAGRRIRTAAEIFSGRMSFEQALRVAADENQSRRDSAEKEQQDKTAEMKRLRDATVIARLQESKDLATRRATTNFKCAQLRKERIDLERQAAIPISATSINPRCETAVGDAKGAAKVGDRRGLSKFGNV